MMQYRNQLGGEWEIALQGVQDYRFEIIILPIPIVVRVVVLAFITFIVILAHVRIAVFVFREIRRALGFEPSTSSINRSIFQSVL
jgi:hypothetical protein